MIEFAIYIILGLIWTYAVDRYSSSILKMPSMQGPEIIIQVFIWPFSFILFVITFIKETFQKKN